MPVEIERKFLIGSDGWQSEARQESGIRQAYLAKTETLSMRVRIIDDARAKLTIKSALQQMARDEFEYEIPLEDAQRLMALRYGAVIEKTRYALTVGDADWTIDVFSGDNAGLVMAEIELDDPGQAFERPTWLGAEVTGDPRYYNAELAARPYRDWDRASEGI